MSRLYPNGFFFTQKEMDAEKFPKHYKSQRIFDYHYYFDEDVTNCTFEDSGYFIIIHGLYVHIDASIGNVTENSHEILLNLFINNKSQFFKEMDFVAGRFAIIIGNEESYEVYHDATGMRTVFYSKKDKSIGSHVNLMNELLILEEDELFEITKKSIESWDNTQYSDLKSLNPNHFYSSNSNKSVRFFPQANNAYKSLNHKNKLKLFEILWKEQLSYFLENFDNVIFSITGGADSRVSLSLAKEYIDKMKFFTYAPTTEVDSGASNATKSLIKDKEIVDQILDVIPLNHQFILYRENKMKLKKEEHELLDKNTVISHGRYLLSQYNHYFPEQPLLHVRANLFEIGRGYFIRPTSNNSESDIITTSKSSFSFAKKDDESKRVIEELIYDKIDEFNYNVKNFDYHVLDLYYWEIRMGRWMAEVLNETDFSFETLLPFNMRAMIDITLSYDLEERKSGYFFEEIINNNYPILNFFGKNELLNLYEQKNKKEREKHKEVFSNFTVHDSTNKKLATIDNEKNIIFLPIQYMSAGNYSKVKFNFSLKHGYISLSLFNSYFNSNGTNYLTYQIEVNDKLYIEEDIALWKNSIDIVISGLSNGDIITIKVLSRRNSSSISWEKASELKILKFQEAEYKVNLPLKVSTNSPYSIQINEVNAKND